MNEYEYLFSIKQYFDNCIKQNPLFTLKKELAFEILLKKLHPIMYLSLLNPLYFKKITNTSYQLSYSIDFFQEAVKWIFRWCILYCPITKGAKVKITIGDVENLLSFAYSYEKYHNFWFLHSKGLVEYSWNNNLLSFCHKNEYSCKYHYMYNTYNHNAIDSKKRSYLSPSLINPKHNQNNVEEMFKKSHLLGFSSSLSFPEFDLGGFAIKDYINVSFHLNLLAGRMAYAFSQNRIIDIRGYLNKELFMNRSDWISDFSDNTDSTSQSVEMIIDLLTLSADDGKADPSITHFIPLDGGKLYVHDQLFMISHPEANFYRLLANRKIKAYDILQNQFEQVQRDEIENALSSKYMVTYSRDREKALRSGIDIVVYDSCQKALHLIELKYKIPVDSVQEGLDLDNMLLHGVEQSKKAYQYGVENIATILTEYFGTRYVKERPNKILSFVLTNYSVGTGINLPIPSPILIIQHYIDLMNDGGSKQVEFALNSISKGVKCEIKRIPSTFAVDNLYFNIPQYELFFH